MADWLGPGDAHGPAAAVTVTVAAVYHDVMMTRTVKAI